MKAGGHVGVGGSPFLKLADDFGTYSGGTEGWSGFPYFGAGDTSEGRWWGVPVFRWAGGKELGEGKLPVLIQPGSKQRFGNGALRLAGDRLENWRLGLAHHNGGVDV